MPLNSQAQALLEEMSKQGLPPFEQMSPTFARVVAMSFRDLQGEPENVAEVRDILVPGPAGKLPVRVYHPGPGEKLPLLVYFHGGGWVIGDIEVVDRPCRALANAGRCVVASVNYRLSPETKFPGPVEDCYAATAWLAAHAAELGADPLRVGVGGDSAGGNLAAAVTLMARDRNGPKLAFQLLIYPVTAPAKGTTFASYTENAENYLLTRAAMEWFWDHYLNTEDEGRNPYASPLFAADHSRLPPAMVITAEFDPLRDEGEAYAERLHAAGVPVALQRYDGMFHGFFAMTEMLDTARDAMELAKERLRQAFAV